jgi:hypothetical protein
VCRMHVCSCAAEACSALADACGLHWYWLQYVRRAGYMSLARALTRCSFNTTFSSQDTCSVALVSELGRALCHTLPHSFSRHGVTQWRACRPGR